MTARDDANFFYKLWRSARAKGAYFFESLEIRSKLIIIFVAIKVVPLVLLAWFAWQAAQDLGLAVSNRAMQMIDSMRLTQEQTGKTANQDAVQALDVGAREAIESLTTDLARQVADFLYDRDKDVLQAATLEPSAQVYRRFLAHKTRELYVHGQYQPSADGKEWVLPTSPPAQSLVRTPLADNANNFHARSAENYGSKILRPLFFEMSFIDTHGMEQVKIQQGDLLKPGLRNVSLRENTFVKAETYWPALTRLKAGEVYVSEVIGPYVRAQWIGPYTPARALELSKPFKPEESGYAGLENPVGKHFRGIVRWATPVLSGGRIVGYVTLALDHAHLMAFSNGVRPTPERFAPIADPASGNYAFIWDQKSRAISHPRDYFIVGVDPDTGQAAAPWMDTELWDDWRASGKSWSDYQPTVALFRDQSLKRKPAPQSSQSGSVALDCRYLNFSPQCHGWDALTEHGGSGSFTIFFSGLWKLTTAATIPYFTGQYGASERGFGYVTIGANVDDFHKAATASGRRIDAQIAHADTVMTLERSSLQSAIGESLKRTAIGLASSTLIMVVLVIWVAFLMAGFLTRRITGLSRGIRRFQRGEMAHRLTVQGKDEMADLARSFNHMADDVQQSFCRIEESHISMMEALGRAIAKRDSDTGVHNYRVAWIAARIAERMGFTGITMQALIAGSFLHDVGKIGIPDAILLKPGKLNEAEWITMRSHVTQGEEIVSGMGWLDGASAIVAGHHEKWDGSGYPRGLQGEQIPLEARIFCVADVFDALCSKRPYKEAMGFDAAMQILERDTGSHFDPEVMDLFRTMALEIYNRLAHITEEDARQLLKERIQKHFVL